jgi:hypothetical protein
MRKVRASSLDYYSHREALRAAEQLIELLQREQHRGFFAMDDVVLRARETALVFSGAEYLAFARRGIQDAIAMTASKEDESADDEQAGGTS